MELEEGGVDTVTVGLSAAKVTISLCDQLGIKRKTNNIGGQTDTGEVVDLIGKNGL